MERDARLVRRRVRRPARLDRFSGRRILNVHRGVRGGAGRQRAGVLRGIVLVANALCHQSVHHEYGRRRPAHDRVLRAVLVRGHALVAVLAVRQRLVSYGQLRSSRRRSGIKFDRVFSFYCPQITILFAVSSFPFLSDLLTVLSTVAQPFSVGLD